MISNCRKNENQLVNTSPSLVALNVMRRKWLLRLIWPRGYCSPRSYRKRWSRPVD